MKASCLLLGILLLLCGSPGLAQQTDTLTPADEPARYAVDFDDVSLQEFIATVGRITGKRFIVDPRVRGNISLQSQRSLSADEIYRVFQNELQVNGYATVSLGDGQVKVVPDQAARTQPIPVGSAAADGNVIATQVIETQHLDAATLAGILQPLVDTRVGAITPYPQSHLLVVTDWSDNLQRLARLAAMLDRSRDASAEVVPLRYAGAQDLAGILDSVLQGEESSGARVVADTRANALVVFGSQNERQRVKRLITSLDSPGDRNTNTRVIYLNHASAENVIEVLRSLRDGGFASSAAMVPPDALEALQPAMEGADDAANVATGSAPRGVHAAASNGNGEVAFAVHPSTNALVLTGPATQLDGYQRIIERLDIRRAQVAVEAIIAEITESRARQLGVQWLFGDTGSDSVVPVGSVNFSSSSAAGINQLAAAAATDDTSALGALLGGVNGITTGVGRLSNSGVSFAALLNALRSDADTNLLSTPSLTTLDNAEAYILVGQEVPFVTGSTTVDNANPYQTIQREDVGIKLNIRPQISADNTIRMQITQEVSSIASNVRASDVVTNKREIETTVITQDGGIIILGGLISDQSSSTRQRVPLLGDIPLLGNLFRYSSNDREKQNLMVFIRARVLRDAQTLDAATAQKYRYMRAQQVLNDFDAEQTLPALDTLDTSPSLQTLYPAARERLGSLAP